MIAFRFVLCALPNGQREPRNVVAYQAIIERYLLAWPKMGLNNQNLKTSSMNIQLLILENLL